MFKKTCETLDYMEIIVFKIPHGAKTYLSHGLYLQNVKIYLFSEAVSRYILVIPPEKDFNF